MPCKRLLSELKKIKRPYWKKYSDKKDLFRKERQKENAERKQGRKEFLR